MKTVVYTAIIGRYDLLKRQPQTGDEFIAFVNSRIKKEAISWKVIKCDLPFKSNVIAAKWYKMMPHKLFPDCEYSLWMDGSVELKGDRTVAQLVEKYMGDADVVLFKHSTRNCIYEEAWECIKKGLDDKDTVYRQVSRYTQEGYPSNLGLAEATVLLRKHSKAVNSFNEAWWEEVSNYSARDQISFNFLAHKMGIKVNYFPNTIHDNPLFKKHRHRSIYKNVNFYQVKSFSKEKIWKMISSLNAKTF